MKTAKEIPILMSTQMVQASLAGDKTKTRRVIKHPKRGIIKGNDHLGFTYLAKENAALLNGPDYPDGPEDEVKCRYGRPGDILWVRETWFYNDSMTEPYGYKADYNHEAIKNLKGHFKPSIHMPKEASRLWLEVVSVRVERLHDISEEDAKAEGAQLSIYHTNSDKAEPVDESHLFFKAARYKFGFEGIWKKINNDKKKPEAHWDANPWLWAIEFKRIEKPLYHGR